jgi:hypothetical protein
MNETVLPLSDCIIVQRTNTVMSDCVETGIRMVDTHGRYDAARYLIMNRVGFHVVARVLTDPAARRRTD